MIAGMCPAMLADLFAVFTGSWVTADESTLQATLAIFGDLDETITKPAGRLEGQALVDWLRLLSLLRLPLLLPVLLLAPMLLGILSSTISTASGVATPHVSSISSVMNTATTAAITIIISISIVIMITFTDTILIITTTCIIIASLHYQCYSPLVVL